MTCPICEPRIFDDDLEGALEAALAEAQHRLTIGDLGRAGDQLRAIVETLAGVVAIGERAALHGHGCGESFERLWQ